MNINEKKFIDVFVDLVENGKVISNQNNIELRYERTDVSEYINQFEDYLFDKMDEIAEDEYDNWLEKLTFENIDKRDIIKYHLPEEKIIIESVAGQNMIAEICSTIRNAYDEALAVYKNYNDANITFGYSFSTKPHSIYVVLAAFSNCNMQVYRKIKNIISDCEKKCTALTKEFSSSQSIFTIAMDNRTSASDTYIDESKMTEDDIEDRKEMKKRYEDNNIVNFKVLSLIDEDLVYKRKNSDKTQELESYKQQLFAYLTDEEVYNNHYNDDKLAII